MRKLILCLALLTLAHATAFGTSFVCPYDASQEPTCTIYAPLGEWSPPEEPPEDRPIGLIVLPDECADPTYYEEYGAPGYMISMSIDGNISGPISLDAVSGGCQCYCSSFRYGLVSVYLASQYQTAAICWLWAGNYQQALDMVDQDPFGAASIFVPVGPLYYGACIPGVGCFEPSDEVEYQCVWEIY